MPRIPVKIAMNVGNPQLAFEFAQLPNAARGYPSPKDFFGEKMVEGVEQGIESLSLNPDTVVSTRLSLAEAPPAEKKSAVA